MNKSKIAPIVRHTKTSLYRMARMEHINKENACSNGNADISYTINNKTVLIPSSVIAPKKSGRESLSNRTNFSNFNMSPSHIKGFNLPGAAKRRSLSAQYREQKKKEEAQLLQVPLKNKRRSKSYEILPEEIRKPINRRILVPNHLKQLNKGKKRLSDITEKTPKRLSRYESHNTLNRM